MLRSPLVLGAQRGCLGPCTRQFARQCAPLLLLFCLRVLHQCCCCPAHDSLHTSAAVCTPLLLLPVCVCVLRDCVCSVTDSMIIPPPPPPPACTPRSLWLWLWQVGQGYMEQASEATALGAEYQENFMDRVILPMMAAEAEAEPEAEPEAVA